MTVGLAHIFRHPIKGHGREELASVRLSEGAALPWDRHWAVAHEAARLSPEGGWSRCINFARGAKAPALMAISSRLDEARREITLTHPDRPALRFSPDREEDLAAFLDWVMPLNPPDRARPVRIVSADVALTDSAWPSVSILSLASNRDLGQRMGRDLSIHRWRANLWLDGLAPWIEFDLIGRKAVIGDVVLEIRERITRCKATTVDPETGRVDGDTLAALQQGFGHQDFGVYAAVIRGGTITAGDRVEIQ